MMKRILRGLRLDKIAAVDRPCQEPATMTIMKRAEPVDDADYMAVAKRKWSADQRKEAEQKGWAMSGGRYPIETVGDLEDAIHAVGRGKGSHASIRAHIMSRAKALGASDKIPDDWKVSKILKSLRADMAKASLLAVSDDDDEGAEGFDEVMADAKLSQELWDNFYKATDALRQSICSILKDETVSDKQSMIEESLKEFADYVQGIIPGDVGKSLADGFSAALVGAADATLKGVLMSKELKKALGLSETASDADIIAAIGKRDEDLKKANDELVIAKMSDKHKAYHAKLSGDAKDKFAAMSPAERDKAMGADDDADCEKALAKGDAFKATDGHVFHKRDFGTDAAYHFAKSQNETIAKQAEEIAKAKEDKAVADFAKRAKDTFGDEAFGATLRKAYSGDVAAQAEVEKRTAALKKQADEGGLFVEKGGRGSPAAGSAEAELFAKRDDLRKSNPKLTEAQAFAKVYEDRANADIVKRYKAEQGRAA